MIKLSLSEPGGAQQEFIEIARDYIVAERPKLLLAGFAYVTTKGVNTLIHSLDSSAWKNMEKRFLIGVHQGITEPQALRMLRSQPKSSLRAYVPGQKLTQAALFSTPLYHPKTMLFRKGKGPKRELFVVSSANLTGSAIGPNSRNYECGQVTSLEAHNSIGQEFSSWWTGIWNNSRGVDTKFIKSYSSIRIRSFKKNPDLLRLVEPADDIQSATSFWIEVGKASGIERHQVEFPTSLASFFGKPQKKRIDLTLMRKNKMWSGRPLTHKRTTYGVDIWRLGMPTIKKGGEPIQDRVILFKRTPDVDRFEFEIADQGSSQSEKWLQESSAFGHLGRTGGSHSRQYGYV